MANFYKPPKKTRQPNKANTLAHSGHSKLHIIDRILIDRLSDDGRGISTINGKTIFIEGALPNETVATKIVSEKSRFIEGIVEEIVTPASTRTEAECQYYGLCGGCHVQHMITEEQHHFKQQAILQQLKRWANIEPETILPTIVGDHYRYRQRVRLGVVIKSGKVTLGFRQKNSKLLIDIDQCPVMRESLSCLLHPISGWLKQYQPDVSHIELIYSEEKVGVVVRHTRPIGLTIRGHLQSDLKPLNAQCWFQGKKQADLQRANGSYTDPRLSYSVMVNSPHNRILQLSYHPQDFIQGNAKVNQQMILQAIDLLKPQCDEHFLDLFCGVGNFSLPLSLYAKEVTGIEGVKGMVSRAATNAEMNECNNVCFLHADLSSVDRFNQHGQPYDGIILDPPRGGAKAICENINKLMPKRIVYVSCDSTTFTRDAQLLCNHNYKLKTMGVMDMFPQTSHSEIMGLFVHPSWSTA